MTVQISGDTGVSAVQPGVVAQGDLAANVVGNGPCFSAQGVGTNTPNITDTTQLVAEQYDTANAYNPATGTFTAPISGWYAFAAYVDYGAYAATGKALIITTTAGVIAAEYEATTSGGTYVSQSINAIAYLAASETAKVSCYIAGGGPITPPTVRFSGCLIRSA